MHPPDSEPQLRRRLERVRRRLADDVPHSPDWDAAMAELEEVETALASLSSGPTYVASAGSLSPSAEA
jgi:hypothetical protein